MPYLPCALSYSDTRRERTTCALNDYHSSNAQQGGRVSWQPALQPQRWRAGSGSPQALVSEPLQRPLNRRQRVSAAAIKKLMPSQHLTSQTKEVSQDHFSPQRASSRRRCYRKAEWEREISTGAHRTEPPSFMLTSSWELHQGL